MKNIYGIVLFLIFVVNLSSQDIVITSHPESIKECAGNAAYLSVSAYSTSNYPLSFQWYKDNEILIGEKSPILLFPELQHFQSGTYFCLISTSEYKPIKSQYASLYVLRSSSITKQPKDVNTNLSNGTISIDFDAHLNGFENDDNSQIIEYVSIQWYLIINGTKSRLNNGIIFNGVHSNILSINLGQLPDTSYFFAEVKGKCGIAQTRTASVIKNKSYVNLEISALEGCEGNIETIKAQITNTNNHKLEFQWYKDGKPIYYKENVKGIFSDELIFNPIKLLDAGKYKLEAKIKDMNYSAFSNEVDVTLCSKPEVIAIRIDTMTGSFINYKQAIFHVFFKRSCNSKMNVYKNDSLIVSHKLDEIYMSNYDVPNPEYSGIGIIQFEKSDIDAKYSVLIYNDCGISQSDTITVRDNLNDFEGRDPLKQYREFCEDDTTSLRFYFTYVKPNNYKRDYTWSSDGRLDCNPEFYSGCRSNVLQFKKLRKVDNGMFYLKFSGNTTNIKKYDSIFIGTGFVIKVKPKPDIKRQPISKNVQNEERDTLIYILFDNEPQLPISIELYYMANLSSTPRLIDKTEAEYGMWYRYIKDVTYSDAGYYYAKVNHENDCSARYSDTVKVTVVPKATTDISYLESNSDFLIQPNPASDFIMIQTSEVLKTSEVSSLQIFDILGVEVKDLSPALSIGEGVRIDVSHLPAGVYFIKLSGSNGASSIVGKFVKM